ncbi:MAG: amidoligase family protein [Planctomycetota bacterium]
MPTLTATAELIECPECHRHKPRVEFAVMGDVCLECFDAKYRFCENCGKVIAQSGDHCLLNRTVYHDGRNLCFQCYDWALYGERGSNWRPVPFGVSFATYGKIGSTRKYGVEIETASCEGWEELSGNTRFGAKDDCTVNGKEFDSPVLYGDEGLDAIRAFLSHGENNDWHADEDCGCHTHYDVRDLSYDQLCSVTYAYRKSVAVWKALVAEWRRHHDYSRPYEWTCADFKRAAARNSSYSHLLCDLERDSYEYVRFSAYSAHNTFENRMLEGTCDAELICNWIKLNCRFIDAVKDMSIEEIDAHFGRGQRHEHVGPFCELVGDDLTDFIYDRAEKNGRPFRN